MTLQQTDESLKEPPTVRTLHSHYILTTTVGTVRYIQYVYNTVSHIYTCVPEETPTVYTRVVPKVSGLT